MRKTWKLAEIFGAELGDGWIEARGGAFYICGHKIEDKDYYDSHLIPLFSKTITKVKGKEYPYWNVYGFHMYNNFIIDKLNKLGLPKGRKTYTARVPNWIFESQSFMIAVLRGLFDTDGNIYFDRSRGKYDNKFRREYNHSARISFKLTSKQLCKDIRKIGIKLGFNFTKIQKRKANIFRGKHNSPSYVTNLNKIEDIKRWFKTIKPGNSKHITKYLVWKKFGFCPPKTTIIERQKVLKGKINPYSYYAGMPEWSIGAEI